MLEQLGAAAPAGIDVYFDNVGGDHLEAALATFNYGGRAAICGKIRSDDADKAFPLLADAMAKFCDVDGEGGRSVFPRAHDPFVRAAEVRKYDTLSLQDRLMAMKFAPDIHHLVAPRLAIDCHRDPASAALVDQL